MWKGQAWLYCTPRSDLYCWLPLLSCHSRLFGKRGLSGRVAQRSWPGYHPGWEDSQIIEEVIKVSSSSLFKVDREDIRIQRVQGRPEVSVIVNFSRTEGFLSEYIYVFHFRFLAQGPAGT